MPSSILQTPLWLQAEQELRNQLTSFDEGTSQKVVEDEVSLADTTLGRHEASYSNKGVKAAASLGVARHFFTIACLVIVSSAAYISI